MHLVAGLEVAAPCGPSIQAGLHPRTLQGRPLRWMVLKARHGERRWTTTGAFARTLPVATCEQSAEANRESSASRVDKPLGLAGRDSLELRTGIGHRRDDQPATPSQRRRISAVVPELLNCCELESATWAGSSASVYSRVHFCRNFAAFKALQINHLHIHILVHDGLIIRWLRVRAPQGPP